MAGTLAAIIIVFWFYRTAENKDRPPLPAAFLGFVVYLIPAILWTKLITPSIRLSVEHNPSFMMALMAQYAYIITAVCCAAFVHFRHFADPK